MKKMSISLIFLGSVVSSTFCEPKFDLNIRYVDSFAALRDSQEGKAVTKELEEKRIDLTAEIKKLELEFTTAAKEFQAKASMLSDDGREREQKRLGKMERKYKEILKDADEDMKITMQSKQEQILRELNEAVKEYAQANNVDLVISQGGVVYSSDKANCTPGVVTAMNKNREIKIAKSKDASKTKATA